MKKAKEILFAIIAFILVFPLNVFSDVPEKTVTEIAPGIWKISAGAPEKFVPTAFREREIQTEAIGKLGPGDKLPFPANEIKINILDRGCVIELPLGETEQIYGFGMQIESFNEKGMKKRPIVDCGPLGSVGFTHAPSPFYLSSAGYGVYFDTARYPTFYCGSHLKNNPGGENESQTVILSPEHVYIPQPIYTANMVADIPSAKGIDIYIFAGPTLKKALQRYILFSGGGCIPPLWGLGVKYRGKLDFAESDVSKLAKYFRENDIPCDVLGLEPGWQTNAYSCSYVWDETRFPGPGKFIAEMNAMGFRINLWEHAYVNPASPLFEPLKRKSGDYLVWNGLVPDFADESVRKIFAGYHDNYLLKMGISAFKCDECDNSGFAGALGHWGFPECTVFPSGIDGEQMHQLFGLFYQKTFFDMFKSHNRRTYLDVRASNALASPYSAVLYSDIYDFSQYMRMILTSGLSGFLWSPEVRQCGSVDELLKRVQLSVLSSQTCFNSWMIVNPPWLQYEYEKNIKGEFLTNSKEIESICRQLLKFRMSLIPYLYSAFYSYRFEGIPPFRPLVADFPEDKEVMNIQDEYLIGEDILAAPFKPEDDKREVYLPAGTWYDFNSGREYTGGAKYKIWFNSSHLPLFVKSGAILPLAEPVNCVSDTTGFRLKCRVYGDIPRECVLYEDDGTTFDYEKGLYNILTLQWNAQKGILSERKGNLKIQRYAIAGWEHISSGKSRKMIKIDARIEDSINFLENATKNLLDGCIMKGQDGTLLYTPDGKANYAALWTRDFAYMVENAGYLMPKENIENCIRYLIKGIRADGAAPDRVQVDGKPVYVAGPPDNPIGEPNIDNAQFLVFSVNSYLETIPKDKQKILYKDWSPYLKKCMDYIPRGKDGLVWNDPVKPHSPYGFTDTVGKTGELFMESLLYWRACGMIAKWDGRSGDITGRDDFSKRAGLIEKNIGILWDEKTGMYFAASQDCHQTDIWGNAYAIYINFPLGGKKSSIIDYLVKNFDNYTRNGQVRHLPKGEYWNLQLANFAKEQYQNGAYWATPSGWVISAISEKNPELAKKMFLDLIADFREGGICECVNEGYRNLESYVNSGTNPLAAARLVWEK